MVIFHSYVKLPEGIPFPTNSHYLWLPCSSYTSQVFCASEFKEKLKVELGGTLRPSSV